MNLRKQSRPGRRKTKSEMKRTQLRLDEDLLEEAKGVLGSDTYSDTVNAALAEVLRLRRIMSLPSFFNQRLWDDDLAKMRHEPQDDQRSADFGGQPHRAVRRKARR